MMFETPSLSAGEEIGSKLKGFADKSETRTYKLVDYLNENQ